MLTALSFGKGNFQRTLSPVMFAAGMATKSSP
jgi:hypothetical protein